MTVDQSESDSGPETTRVRSAVNPVRYVRVGVGSPQEISGEIVAESLVCISVNGKELSSFMCSPSDLEELALGFLYNEGLISGMDDVRSVHLSKGDTCADVWLNRLDFTVPERSIVTAGCGGGITFDDLSQSHEPLTSEIVVRSDVLVNHMKELHLGAQFYKRARGIHTAALANDQTLLLQVEDVGRHNCLDKLAGAALLNDIETRDRIILSSGRVSSEMVNKARRLEAPIICSRTSPTSLSVALAEAWNLTIVAYLRQDRMRIYSHQERILLD